MSHPCISTLRLLSIPVILRALISSTLSDEPDDLLADAFEEPCTNGLFHQLLDLGDKVSRRHILHSLLHVLHQVSSGIGDNGLFGEELGELAAEIESGRSVLEPSHHRIELCLDLGLYETVERMGGTWLDI